MKQFGTILKFELKGYLKNKIFIGVTVFAVLAIAAVMFFPRLSALFQSDGEETESVREVMLLKVPAETENDVVITVSSPVFSAGDVKVTTANLLAGEFSSVFSDYEVKVTTADVEEIKREVTEGNCAFAVVLDSLTSFTYYVNNLSMYDMNAEMIREALLQVYRMNGMIAGGMSPEAAGELLSAQISGETVSLGKDQMQNFFYTYIMIFALYMVILLYGQMVATNVASEKSSRAMELLITSANPISMMFGKVIASCLAGLCQLIAVFGSAALLYQCNKSVWAGNQIIDSIFNIPVELLVYMLVFFVLGFFIYAFLYGAIGSTASKLEDINTSVLPITFFFIIAFMVVVFSMAGGNVDNMAMKVCSFIPFTSPMAMFTRIAMSTVAWYEIAISIGLLVGSVVGIGVLCAKIYRVGVLLYGTRPKLIDILKTVWRA